MWQGTALAAVEERGERVGLTSAGCLSANAWIT